MPKRNNREKQEPNFVVFLVEGDSDRIALELPLSELIDQKHPEYQVRFLFQERRINLSGDELEDEDSNEDEDGIDDDSEDNCVLELGGDITTSSFVTPNNIEIKITNRFIMPVVIKEGIYPKRIARIIHIVDLDGAYIPDTSIVPLSFEHRAYDHPFYDGEKGIIEAANVPTIIDRNDRKRRNLEYLLSLSEIKIKTKRVPYELYFFSSNLDHFINHDANIEGGKKRLADLFMRNYGLDNDAFVSFFFNDERAIGHMGYEESWKYIKEGSNSVRRFTNIDCLIRKLLED